MPKSASISLVFFYELNDCMIKCLISQLSVEQEFNDLT